MSDLPALRPDLSAEENEKILADYMFSCYGSWEYVNRTLKADYEAIAAADPSRKPHCGPYRVYP